MTAPSCNTVSKWLHGEVDDLPKYRPSEQHKKLAAFRKALKQAPQADARRPKHERQAAKAPSAEFKTAATPA